MNNCKSKQHILLLCGFFLTTSALSTKSEASHEDESSTMSMKEKIALLNKTLPQTGTHKKGETKTDKSTIKNNLTLITKMDDDLQILMGGKETSDPAVRKLSGLALKPFTRWYLEEIKDQVEGLKSKFESINHFLVMEKDAIPTGVEEQVAKLKGEIENIHLKSRLQAGHDLSELHDILGQAHNEIRTYYGKLSSLFSYPTLGEAAPATGGSPWSLPPQPDESYEKRNQRLRAELKSEEPGLHAIFTFLVSGIRKDVPEEVKPVIIPIQSSQEAEKHKVEEEKPIAVPDQSLQQAEKFKAEEAAIQGALAHVENPNRHEIDINEDLTLIFEDMPHKNEEIVSLIIKKKPK